MADLEATLADISYIIISNEPCPTRPIVLPDPSVQYVVAKYLQENGLISFDNMFNEKIGYSLFRMFMFDKGSKKCMEFFEMIVDYKSMDCTASRKPVAKQIYNKFIMPDLLAMDHPFDLEYAYYVRDSLTKNETDPELFDNYLMAVKEYLRKNEYHVFVMSQYYTRYLQWKFVELNSKIKKDDFIVHRIIGRGGFGEVYGCRKVDTGMMCAIKYLYKKRLKLKNKEKMAFEEREMLAKFDSPFIVGLNYAFQTEEKLCFVLDLLNGGDLSYHLRQRKRFTEDEAMFYAAEILLGLEHMHSKNIVYRDLKPANVLMDSAGHVKLSDLGLATDFSKKMPTSSVGTPGYIAPEVHARGTPYNSCADWYSYGCTIVKLLTGQSPPTPSPDSLSLPASFAETFSPDTDIVSLVSGLLEYSPDMRLGNKGSAEIKSHPWFRPIDWTLAGKHGLQPPFTPSKGEVHAYDAVDIGTFNEDDVRGIKITKEDEEFFKNFDIFPSDRWQREILANEPMSCFNIANQNADKVEYKNRGSCEFYCGAATKLDCKCILQGYMFRLGRVFMSSWQRKYFCLYPDQLEWRSDPSIETPVSNTIHLCDVVGVQQCAYKSYPNCIRLDVVYRNNTAKDPDIVLLRCETDIEQDQWLKHLTRTLDEYRSTTQRDKEKRLSDQTIIEGGWAFVESIEFEEEN